MTIVRQVDLSEPDGRKWMKLIYDPDNNCKANEFVKCRKLRLLNDNDVRRFFLPAGIFVVGTKGKKNVWHVKVSRNGSAQYVTSKEANSGANGAWKF